MNLKTVSVTVSAPKDQVFAYLADVENMPEWATQFCKELKVVNGKHKVLTPRGEIFFRIQADEKMGVIDMFGGPTEDQMALFPTRVLDVPGGGSAFLFTLFQEPGVTDQQFEEQLRELRQELENVKRHFDSR
ncbi:MAG: SRPBCC family protein [Acidobacteriota bacterium]